MSREIIMTRKGNVKVDGHWSQANRRWCINLVPCVTLWATLPGGNTP